MTAFLTIFRRFPTNFPKTSEDIQRLPRTFEEDPKMFRSYTNELKHNLRDKLDISEMENMDVVSYEYNFTSGEFSSKTLVSI